MVLELLEALDPAVFDITDLVGVELGPLTFVELLVEIQDEQGMHEVHESVTHIGLVLKVYRQIQEVILAQMVLVNFLKEGFLSVFVRNVLYHDRGPLILCSFDLLNIEVVMSIMI